MERFGTLHRTYFRSIFFGNYCKIKLLVFQDAKCLVGLFDSNESLLYLIADL